MTRRGSWMRWGLSVVMVSAVLGLTPEPASAPSHLLYVNRTDPLCQGQAPCYPTIQAAIDAATSSDVVVIQPGTYPEQLTISGKNNFSGASESHRIVIEADPAAPVGSVVLQGTVSQCTNGHAIRLQQSKFITIRGLTITGAGSQAISLLGGNNQNTAIVLERNRIFGNGSSECNGGITVARGNPGTLIINNLIHGNGRNGITFLDADGGPHAVVENTIHGNAWNGVSVARNHFIVLVNNLIAGNGTAAGSTGGRFGVTREASAFPLPWGILLSNNLLCGNRLGEINGPALDGTDSGNLTPTGSEGPGVSASPGCQLPSTVYATLNGADGQPGTGDDDFTLATGSPALDRGFDLRTFLFDPIFTPLLARLQADYTREGARPQPGSPTATAQFDIGAMELSVQDIQAPTVTFLQPAANALVRQAITVEAQATDNVAVTSLALSVGSQPLSATLTPPPPASPITATATLDTTSLADGAHTLHAVAFDQAGNSKEEQRVITVDNTPPNTQIDSGPSGEIAVTIVTFTWSGDDNLTLPVNLVFAYRVDGGAWSVFSSGTSATLPNLAETDHVFDIKARDAAGNEDPTPASRSFTVRFGPSITNVNPSSGPIGTFVTIIGRNFEAGATQVTFTGAGATNVAAVIRTITATSITTTVPIGAGTGPLTVTTARGSASQPFTVTASGDFTLTAAPGTARVIAGDQTSVSIGAGGSGNFTSLVNLSLSAAPAGITPMFDSPLVAPGSGTFITLAVAATVAPGTYPFTVTGRAQVDGQEVTREVAFTLEVLSQETPAITGRVLTADAVPQPIPGVTVALGSAFTLTDAGGNFVLLAPPPGQNMLLVDGRTASTPTAQYPPVEVNIAVNASGPTRVPFIVYLPKLDTANPITLPLDPSGAVTQTIQATTPTIPGLVVTIPQGTRIIGPDGNPVSQITITPVPIDRSPMPFPPGVTFPMLFTIQPGGAVPSTPLPITFPNVQQAPPGETADLYFFDLIAGNWQIWGQGTVNDDGTQIVSDPGFGLPRFAWHSTATLVSLSDEVRSRHTKGGEPVDLVTGRFVVNKTDLILPGRLPVTIQRTYRSENPRPGLLGIGWTLDLYDSLLTQTGPTLLLTLADQSSYRFAPAGTGQWRNTTEPAYQSALITQLPGDFQFQLQFKDGTVHRYARIIGFSNQAALTAITDRSGNTLTISRPALNQVSRIDSLTEPSGRQLTLTYDAANRITTITDPIGRVVRYTYDGLGRLDTVTDPANGETRYTYDASHRITTITDPRNIPFLTNEYDAQGRVIRQTQADGGVWQFAYTLTGNVITQTTVTDPRGNPTAYHFNSQGFTLAQTDALGQTTTNEYAPGSNLLLSTTDSLGRTTRFGYDTQGNVTTLTDPLGNQRTFTYDPTFNKVTSITTAPIPTVTTFEYDLLGNLTAITDPEQNLRPPADRLKTRIAYTPFGQPEVVTDPLGNQTKFFYTPQGDLERIEDPLQHSTRREYDAVSRLIRQTDPLGNVTTFGYDALNRLRQILDAAAGLTEFSYDENGNLLTVTDARGNTITHRYDDMDRLKERIDQLGKSETFAYDGLGNLTTHTDRKGQVSTFTYDALNRRTAAVYADSATSFEYDAGGRLTRATDSVGGEILNSYDTLDRLTAQVTTLGTVSYQYDTLGRRRTMTAPGQPPVSYDYDANSRLVQILQDSQIVNFQYDALGRRRTLTLPNQVSTEYQYDTASRLTALIYRNALGPLGDLTYQYDPTGNHTAVGGSFARTLLPDPIASASYDAANRQRAFGPSTLDYNLNGNLISDGVSTYAWNARNQLVGINGASLTATFQDDPLGRRTRKTINGAATDYLYDGLNPVQEASGASVANLLTGLGIDEYFTRTDAGGTRHFLTDVLGSTIALTDAAGTLETQYTYEAFGRTSSTGPASANPFQFTGRENDEVSGIYYYRNRHYSPTMGRFLSEDPLHSPLRKMSGSSCQGNYAPNVSWYLDVDPGLALLMMFRFYEFANSFVVDPKQVHLYTYVYDNPVNKVDPMGLLAAPQTAGCDPGDWGFNRCATKCCNEHDDCYKRAYFSWCDQSTWLEQFFPYVRYGNQTRVECQECNSAVLRCLARATWHWGSRRKDPC